MKRIILLKNLSKENVSDIDESLAYSGVIYTVDIEDEAVIIQGDNDALNRARIALSAAGFTFR